MFAYIFVFILGLCIGSFLNVVILRLHREESMLSRSQCLSCRKTIAWYDNIPLASFFLLRGRCRHCHKRISWQYPIVEFVTAILFVLAYQNIGFQVSSFKFQEFLELFRNLVFISLLIVVFAMDFRWYMIYDIITIPGSIAAFLLNILLGWHWADLVYGGIIGAGFFFAQYLISHGKWIGGGDIRLGLFMGLMLGWKLLLFSIFFAYISGALVGLVLILFGIKRFSSKIPFGTFLSASAIFALLYGEIILQWYLQLIT